MRTPCLTRGARAPIQSIGLVGPCQGHPRAALDTGDLRISNVLLEHPVESDRQPARRRHLGHAFGLVVAPRLILLAKSFVQPARGLYRLDQQLAHESIALLADRAQPLLAARRVLARDQAYIAGHLPAVLEPAHIA